MFPRSDAKADLDRAMLSYQNAAKGLESFQAACTVGDWEAAEMARERVIGSYESFMDNYAAAFRT